MSLFYDAKKFLVSKTCSDNIYIDSGRAKTFNNMFGQETLPLVKHFKSEEKFLLCPTAWLDKKRTAFYLNAIEKPMYHGFVWPIDMVNADGLIFKQKIGNESTYHSLWSYTKDNFVGFEDKRVKTIIFNFLSNLQNFFDNGYVYRYWDERNIYFGDRSNEVIFQFNNHISRKNNTITLSKRDYYTELTDPYMYYHEGSYDFYSDVYSFQSLLFKLLIGIYPFEGEGMTGYERNGTQTELDGWIMEYLRNVYFIFDDESSRNHIGIMGVDVPRVKRWESLTPNLRRMFNDVFSRSNVLRENNDIIFYTPLQWIQELQKFDFELKKS